MNLALKTPRYRMILTGLLALSILLGGLSAFAQTVPAGINFTLSIEPASLTAPGTVTVSARVSNASAEDINTPLSLYDPDGKLVTAFSDGGSLQRLPSGENYLWQGQYSVKQAQLDEGKLVYTLRYSSQDTTGGLIELNIPASVDINYTGEKVDLKVNRTITPEVVRRGKELTVIYELINQGNVKLTNIAVKENRLISTRTQNVASLEPGASAKVTFTKANVTGDLSSSATVSYRKEGERQIRQISVEAVDVPLARPALQFELTSDKTQVNIGETAMLTLQLKNAGNISYSNVTVTDPTLGELFTNVQIAAGQTRELQKEVTVNETTTYSFTLKLEDNTGSTQEEKVPDLKVSAYAEGQMLRLNLTLTASSEVITSLPGDIRFDLTVTNDSNTAAKNIRILHATREIYMINELAPGQSTVVSRDFSLSQAGKYQFTAIATDVQNNPVEFTSNPLSIAYTVPTAAPTREVVVTIAPAVTYSPVPENYSPSGGQVRDILFILALAFGVLFALALLLLAVSAIMRAKARAKSNAAYDTFELAGARDYTAEPDETRQAMEPAGAEETVDKAEAQDAREELPHEKYIRAEAKKPEETEAVKVDAGQPIAADEEGVFRLTRENGDAAAKDTAEEPASQDADNAEPQDGEQRNRRSQRRTP